ncbi:MAG: hypothetical protein OXH68_01150 [Gammaproteobacteria bacterium]|nr:hypothetical protein [Gammaproteobacteria bacterium]
MSDIDIGKLIEWLGPDGAIAGLERSNFKVVDLYELASRHGLTVEGKTKRSEIIIELVNGKSVRIDKTPEHLLAMGCEDLVDYLRDRKVSRTELLNLLSKFDIRPSPRDKANLIDFAAREISDVGMYQRVAKGARSE